MDQVISILNNTFNYLISIISSMLFNIDPTNSNNSFELEAPSHLYPLDTISQVSEQKDRIRGNYKNKICNLVRVGQVPKDTKKPQMIAPPPITQSRNPLSIPPSKPKVPCENSTLKRKYEHTNEPKKASYITMLEEKVKHLTDTQTKLLEHVRAQAEEISRLKQIQGSTPQKTPAPMRMDIGSIKMQITKSLSDRLQPDSSIYQFLDVQTSDAELKLQGQISEAVNQVFNSYDCGNDTHESFLLESSHTQIQELLPRKHIRLNSDEL